MEGLTDLHNHSLPGVDDGASDWEMSLTMLAQAWEDGIGQIVLTPHVKPNGHSAPPAVIQGVFDRLVKKAEAQFPKLRLFLGAEILYSSDLMQGENRLSLPTLAGSSYVLVEFIPSASSRLIFNAVNELVRAGYLPILAHVERYLCLRREPDLLEQLADTGAFLQVNAGSILGRSGWKTKRFCAGLLRQGLVSFVASDAHDPKHRRPQLSGCEEHIRRKYGESYAARLFQNNPKKVIRNQRI